MGGQFGLQRCGPDRSLGIYLEGLWTMNMHLQSMMNGDQNPLPRLSFFSAGDRRLGYGNTGPVTPCGESTVRVFESEKSPEPAITRQSPPRPAEPPAEISPEPAKTRQNPPRPHEPPAEISPEPAKTRQNPPREIPEEDDSSESDRGSSADDESDGSLAEPYGEWEESRFRKSDYRLMVELANGSTLRQAAKRAGVSERTAQRRWADTMFRKEVIEFRAQMCYQATGILAKSMTIAAQALLDGLDAKSESVRISSARAILKMAGDLSFKAMDQVIFEHDLNEIVKRHEKVDSEDAE
jgi:hypothetical protein